jgi:hypothetical protein
VAPEVVNLTLEVHIPVQKRISNLDRKGMRISIKGMQVDC